MNTMKRIAFTLAEILIVLGIIGIVAAMTIPTLMNKIEDSTNRTALKKNYTIFTSIYSMSKANGSSFADEISECDTNKFNCFRDLLSKYLTTVKKCNGGKAKGICFPNNVYYKNGTLDTSTHFLNYESAGLILKDGTMLIIYLDNSICNYPREIDHQDECGWITIDTNGFKKPNMWGKDINTFLFYKNILLPSGRNNSCNSTTGYNCAEQVLGYN